MKLGRALILLLLLSLGTRAWAASPWYVAEDATGQPYRWVNGTIVWFIEDGGLGKLSAADTRKLVQEAFAVWEKASLRTADFVAKATAHVKAEFGGVVSDVTEENYLSLAKKRTIVILDNEGEFLADPGLGAVTQIEVRAAEGFQIRTAYLIINGQNDFAQHVTKADDSDSNYLSLKAILVHELGHAFNLDHSVLNTELYNKDGTNADEKGAMPTMFPIIFSKNQAQLHVDDAVALSNLYPTEVYQGEFCEIAGIVIGSDGLGFQGAHVVARSVLDPALIAISAVSGNYFPQDTADGSYVLRGIRPGQPYFVHFEEIDPNWKAWSAVQPYGDDFDETGELPRSGFGHGIITAGDGLLQQVMCEKGGQTILMDTVQFEIAAGGKPPKAQLVTSEQPVVEPDQSNSGDDGNNASQPKSGCTLIPQ